MVVVITGSTRGIGFGLAEAFLARGAKVVVSGRTASAVDEAVSRLARAGTVERVVGKVCDVVDPRAVDALWAAAVETFGGVDVWINNAGACNAIRPFVELESADVDAVVDVNVRGAMNGCLTALRGMTRARGGQIFNMEGWGSRGEWSPGMTPYCATKRALRAFTEGLVRETRGGPVLLGTLSPGIVVTDLLVDSYEHGDAKNFARQRLLFNFVVDPPEKVCAWLAAKVLANRRTGAYLTWMTPLRLLVRFFQPSYWRRNAFAGTKLDALGRGP